MSRPFDFATTPASDHQDRPCPCQSATSGRRYSACCALYHHGPLRLRAPDAATLMRSRYSAYVLDQIDYLQQTWHPSTCPTQIEPNEPGTRWLGLQVIAHQVIDAQQATVEFVARVRNPQGKASRLHEISRFVRENDQWFYVDGDCR